MGVRVWGLGFGVWGLGFRDLGTKGGTLIRDLLGGGGGVFGVFRGISISISIYIYICRD